MNNLTSNVISLAMGAVIGGVLVCYQMLPIECCPEKSPDNTQIVADSSLTAVVANSLIGNYSNNFLQGEQINTKGGQGGTIEIGTLKSLINSAPLGTTHMNVRLGYDPGSGLPTGSGTKVMMIFSCGSLNPPTQGYPIYMNSGSDCYCPTRCD